jgi:TRAP-type mannitol/chloroaromatic compound transport system substrate-binding protein
MLGNLSEIVQTILALIEQSQSGKEEKRQRIRNNFDPIVGLLTKIADEIEQGIEHNKTLEKLDKYARELPRAIEDLVGKKEAKKLFDELISIVSRIALNSCSPEDIRKVSEDFNERSNKTTKQPTNIVFSSISRRQFFCSLAFISAVSIPILINPPPNVTSNVNKIVKRVLKGEKTEWKMVNYFGKDAEGTIIEGAAQRVCDRVREMSDGTFEIEITKRGGVITGDDILRMVNEGKFQCGYSSMYYASEQFRPLYFGCAIPFGLNPQEQNAWLNYRKPNTPPDNDGYTRTYMQTIYSRIDGCSKVIPFPAGATGKQMGGWFNKEINSIDDFNGLKMRIPGLGANILGAFGVRSDKEIYGKPLKVNEIVTKMKEGKIDAAEWIGPHDDMQLGLHEVAKYDYYYSPGWWEPGTTFELQVNVDKYDKLSEQHKEILRAACSQVHLEILNEYEIKNAEALKQLRLSRTLKFPTFDEEIIKKLKDKTKELFRVYDTDQLFKDVRQEYENFKIGIRDWGEISSGVVQKR